MLSATSVSVRVISQLRPIIGFYLQSIRMTQNDGKPDFKSNKPNTKQRHTHTHKTHRKARGRCSIPGVSTTNGATVFPLLHQACIDPKVSRQLGSMNTFRLMGLVMITPAVQRAIMSHAPTVSDSLSKSGCMTCLALSYLACEHHKGNLARGLGWLLVFCKPLSTCFLYPDPERWLG